MPTHIILLTVPICIWLCIRSLMLKRKETPSPSLAEAGLLSYAAHKLRNKIISAFSLTTILLLGGAALLLPHMLIGFLAALSLCPAWWLTTKIQHKAKTDAKTALLTNSIALLNIETQAADIQLWIKKNHEEWPVLSLEIGMEEWVMPIEQISSSLLKNLREWIADSNILINQDMKSDLKTLLNKHGATHPMDIKGAKTVPEIEEFLEATLLPAL